MCKIKGHFVSSIDLIIPNHLKTYLLVLHLDKKRNHRTTFLLISLDKMQLWMVWVCCFNLTVLLTSLWFTVGSGSSSTMKTEVLISWWSTSPLPSVLSCEYLCTHALITGVFKRNWVGLQIQLLSWHVSRGTGDTKCLCILKRCKLLSGVCMLCCIWMKCVSGPMLCGAAMLYYAAWRQLLW